MSVKQPSLLIPVENQVRELDAKLLLACVAAFRGYRSILGPRQEITARIPSFSKGIYISKGLAGRSAMLFQLARKSGHEIVTWDEEALVHLPPEIYFSRRISPAAIKYVSHLFAWGEDNADLWRQYPSLPSELPIHITGNPRGDLLRVEMRSFYKQEVNQIRKAYGDFILVNTNFNHVNAFYSYMNLFQQTDKNGEPPKFGLAAKGMTREYAEGLRDYKQALFEDFKQLIPSLEKTFPDYAIVVRPHPTEKQEVYRKIASQCERVWVTNEGNVVPWLMATKVLVHNSCTTGVEAYILEVPAITYRSSINEYYDFGFYRLPNLLSHQCLNFDELRETLKRILNGELGAANGEERKKLIDRYFSALNGPLACQRIVDVIEDIMKGLAKSPKLSISDRLNRWIVASGLYLNKTIGPYLPRSQDRPDFLKHRYPGISLEELNTRILRLQNLLGYSRELKVEKIYNQIFQISA
jgi:surface carbohydrate biosynthesis protein